MIPEVDDFLKRIDKWSTELTILRSYTLDCGLTETYKWKQPCYTFEGKNLAILANFKDYCGLSFFKGSLLKDPEKVLHKPGPNSYEGRLFKFTQSSQVLDQERIIKAYIYEAIEVEKVGLELMKEKKELIFPEELLQKMEENPDFKNAFETLTPGKQRGYIIYFTGAKQSASRISRIEKYISRILDGKGIQDCVCGESKKYPRCDGSHKFLVNHSS